MVVFGTLQWTLYPRGVSHEHLERLIRSSFSSSMVNCILGHCSVEMFMEGTYIVAPCHLFLLSI